MQTEIAYKLRVGHHHIVISIVDGFLLLIEELNSSFKNIILK